MRQVSQEQLRKCKRISPLGPAFSSAAQRFERGVKDSFLEFLRK